MPLLDLLCLLQVELTGPAEHRITNIFRPLATPAKSEYAVALFVFAITGAIFVVVASLLTYALVRFRRKPGDESSQEPPQVYGSNQIEVAWTVIPILIVFTLLGVTARMVVSIEDAKPTQFATQVTVIGHQFWWEIKYPELGVFTANELHVPLADNAGHATYLKLESADVAHSLWVPQLAGKTDLIPNRDNSMWIDPREPGVFLGNCTEFCGVQHANMRIRVIVQPQPEFERWVAAQKKEIEPDAAMAANRAVYESLSCVSCHNIQGTPSKGVFGPDLSHLMTRQTLGSGAIDNNVENLRAWINDPQDAKPGCLMPSLKLDNKQLDAVVAYLASLR